MNSNVEEPMEFQRQITIRHLRLIKVLGRELNFRRAAEILHTSQPSISRSLMEIEALLQVRLFERTTRRITVTALGRNLIWHAERILGDLDQAQSDFDALSCGASGGLDIGVLRGFSPRLLGRAIELMNDRSPGTEIRLREGFAEDQVSDLLQGRVDLALSHLELSRIEKQLIADVLYEESIGILASPKHPLVRRRQVLWRDLAGERWVLPPIGTTVRGALERTLLIHARGERLPIVEVTAPHFAVALVRESNMLAAVPLQLARWFEKELGAVRRLRLSEELVKWPIYAVRLRSRRISGAATLFVDCLEAAADTTRQTAV